MTEGGKSAAKKEAGSGSVKSAPSSTRSNIERSVEDIFRKFESQPEVIRSRKEIVDEFADIKIEIETPKANKDIQKPRAEKGIQKLKPEKNQLKKSRPVYVAGTVLVVAVVAITLIMIKPHQAPAPDKSLGTETIHKIVLPVPKPRVQTQEEHPAQPIPQGTREPEEVKAFLMEWKTAWENTAGKRGDMETFISFYSDSFTQTGMNKNEWQNDKAQKNSLKKWIRLELNDIHISEPVADNRAEVSFLLTYSSSNYSDKTYQTLILKKEASGWKILEIKTANE